MGARAVLTNTTSTRRAALGIVAAAVLAAVALMAGRVGDTARFVTWPVVAFTALAGVVALVGLSAGLQRPLLLALGVLPALVLSYVLPAAPLPVVAIVLVALGLLVAAVRDTALRALPAGTAAATGLLMVLVVVLQGPAVTCHDDGVSSTSGPWWIPSPSVSSGSASTTADGTARGTTQVGDHRYAYTCANGELTRFERVDDARSGIKRPSSG